MKSFQILDKENNPISINELDKEVCELTDNEQDKKWYCPLGNKKDHKSKIDFIRKCSNWYDTIGWMIASENKSFQDILDYYIEIMKEFIGKKDEDGTIITLEVIYPYHTKVLNTWINKGYKAKQIIE